MDRNEKLREMQILDQNLQNILVQKQAFQLELDETKSAIEEIEKSGDEVFRIIGNLMIKTEKSRIKDELSSREKLIGLRMDTIDKQEQVFAEKLGKIRDEIINSEK